MLPLVRLGCDPEARGVALGMIECATRDDTAGMVALITAGDVDMRDVAYGLAHLGKGLVRALAEAEDSDPGSVLERLRSGQNGT